MAGRERGGSFPVEGEGGGGTHLLNFSPKSHPNTLRHFRVFIRFLFSLFRCLFLYFEAVICEGQVMKFICKSPFVEAETVVGASPRHAAEQYASLNCLDDTTIEVLPIMAGQEVFGQVAYTYAVYARHTVVYDLNRLSRKEVE
jgi:hypothetical protein